MKEIRIGKYDLEGNFLEEYFGSYTKIAKENKVNYTSFVDAVNGRNSSCGKFQFIEILDKLRPKIGSVYGIKEGRSIKPIVKKYKGKTISVYNTLDEACLKNHLSQSHILQSLYGRSKSNGFDFEWI